jgi:multiple sugar transport system permease protein
MKEKRIVEYTRYSILVVAGIAFLLPILWLFLNSIRPERLVYTLSLNFEPTLEYYLLIFSEWHLDHFIANSIIIGAWTTVISLAAGLVGAYGLSRSQREKEQLSFWILSIRMGSPVLVALPLFIMLKTLGLLGKHLGVVIAHTSWNLPFVIWFMKSFFDGVPTDMEESAKMDGCSEFGAFWRVVIPVSLPGIAASAILCFIFSWNEFILSLILTAKVSRTLPVGIGQFSALYTISWGELSASAMVALIPIAVFVFVLQKWFIRGLTMGAVR